MVNSADYPRSAQEILNRVFDATNNRLNTNIGSATQTFDDNILLRFGTDGDQVFLNRSTTLGANTALTNVLVGTPVSQAIAANSLMISNITASGDIAIYGNLGGNSQQYVFIDVSAAQIFLDQADVHIMDGQGVVIGDSTQRNIGGVLTELQYLGTGDADSRAAFGRWSADGVGPVVYLSKSRNATIGSSTIVNNGDRLGTIFWQADDGGDLTSDAAFIASEVDGTPGVDDTPGRMLFATTADGAATATERLRIDSGGNVIFMNVAAVGAAVADQVKLHATDIAAGDARLAIQAELGGVIYIGNNAVRISGNNVLGAQGASIADASGGANIDAEARTALNALLARARTHGLIAT